jgi:hypothetical protein
VRGADIDAPWLFDGESEFRVNGADVIPLVEAELNRRFPGRADRRATDPDGLRAAWAALERTWAAALQRAAAMPAGTVNVSVGGEWSFAQTLRHPPGDDPPQLLRNNPPPDRIRHSPASHQRAGFAGAAARQLGPRVSLQALITARSGSGQGLGLENYQRAARDAIHFPARCSTGSSRTCAATSATTPSTSPPSVPSAASPRTPIWPCAAPCPAPP